MMFNDQWGPSTDPSQVNQTINILKIEMAKESPETWQRIRAQIQENAEV